MDETLNEIQSKTSLWLNDNVFVIFIDSSFAFYLRSCTFALRFKINTNEKDCISYLIDGGCRHECQCKGSKG